MEPPPTPSPLAQAAAPYLPLRVRSWLLDRSPRIVLLDTGMIVELSGEDQAALLGFFRCLTQMDGKGLAGAIVRMSVGGECKVGEGGRASGWAGREIECGRTCCSMKTWFPASVRWFGGDQFKRFVWHAAPRAKERSPRAC